MRRATAFPVPVFSARVGSCRNNGGCQLVDKLARSGWRHVHSAICKFSSGYRIPPIKVAPVIFAGRCGQLGAVLVISPAWIKEVVAQITVGAGTDEHGLVDQQQLRRACSFEPGCQHIKSQILLR